MNIDPILDLVVTQSDKQNLLTFLEEINSSLYKTGGATDLFNSNKIYGPALMKCIPEGFEKMDNNSSSAVITNIIQSVKSIPRIEILLATSPSENTLNQIEEFIKDKTSKQSALDIKIDPSILGGAIFMIDGRYIDLSVSKKLNEAFEGDKIHELLNTKNKQL